MTEYQMKTETFQHIFHVKLLIDFFITLLLERGAQHDLSKLESPELEIFVEYSPKLKQLEYGSDEYKEALAGMGEALRHHYHHNRHHPEHFVKGIDQMNLVDLIEMFCDWIAATERVKDGNIRESIVKNKERFCISDQLEEIFHNTADMFEEFRD